MGIKKIVILMLLFCCKSHLCAFSQYACPKSVQSDIANKVICMQLKVAAQDPTTFSCGYHALKNGILIARSLYTKINPAQDLLDPYYADTLFNDFDSEWQIAVNNERIPILAYLKLLTLFKVKMAKSLDADGTKKVLKSLRFMSKKLAQDFLKFAEVDSRRTHFFKIESKIIEILLLNFGETAENFESIICDFNLEVTAEELKNFNFASSVKNLICLNDIAFFFWEREFEETVLSLWKEKIDTSSFPITYGFLEKIFFYEQKKNNSLFAPNKIDIYDPFTINNLNALSARLADWNNKLVAIIPILIDDRHWITCVINKLPFEKPCYIFTDSYNNSIFNHAGVKELIGNLEGQKKIELVSTNDINDHAKRVLSEISKFEDLTMSPCRQELIKEMRLSSVEIAQHKFVSTTNFRALAGEYAAKLEKIENSLQELDLTHKNLKNSKYLKNIKEIISKNLWQLSIAINKFKHLGQMFKLDEIERLFAHAGLDGRYIIKFKKEISQDIISRDTIINWLYLESKILISIARAGLKTNS